MNMCASQRRHINVNQRERQVSCFTMHIHRSLHAHVAVAAAAAVAALFHSPLLLLFALLLVVVVTLLSFFVSFR